MNARDEPSKIEREHMRRIEDLLEHREWLRDLSRRLVADANLADDLVQKTWLAAMEHPPRERTRPRAWLATVMRNWLRRNWRDEATHRRHEHAASKREPIAGPDELVARAEEMRRVVDAVLALDEPYRTTLLYRHHEGLAPRHIAERMAIPVETVRTRLKRGLAMLRADLDARHGSDGRAWALALLPLTTLPIGPSTGVFVDVASSGSETAAHVLGDLAVKITTKKSVAALLAVLLLIGGGVALVGDPTGSGAAGDREHVADGGPVQADEHSQSTTVGGDESSARTDSRVNGGVTPLDDERGNAPPDADRFASTILVRSWHGRAVPRAQISIYPSPPTPPMSDQWTNGIALVEEPEPTRVGRTDGQGRFTARLPTTGPWIIVTRAAGHATDSRVLGGLRSIERSDGSSPTTITLELGHQVGGWLQNADGSPAPGHTLLADASGGATAARRGSRAVTGPDGGFVLRGLQPGAMQIFVDATQVGSVRAPLTSPITLRLAGSLIRGTVRHEEDVAPIAGAHVWARTSGRFGGTLRAVTDEDGRYELRTLTSELVVAMRVEKDGLTDLSAPSPDRVPTFGSDGIGQLDFTMGKGATLTGVVRLQASVVANAEVSAHGRELRQRTTRTNAAGRYRFEGLPATRVVVQVTNAPGGAFQVNTGSTEGGQPAPDGPVEPATVDTALGETSTLDIDLLPGVVVSGCVLDPEGAPAADAIVNVRGVLSEPTSADGRFVCRGVRPAQAAQIVATRGALRGTSEVDIDRERGAGDVEIQLVPAARVSGTVLTDNGAPVAGSTVEFIVSGRRYAGGWIWRKEPRTAVAADGTFVLTTFEREKLILRAVAAGHDPSPTVVVDVSSGQAASDVALTLTAAPMIRGFVRTTSGDPISGARVALTQGKPRQGHHQAPHLTTAAITGSSGAFEIRDVQRSTWTLTVDAEGFVRTLHVLRRGDEAEIAIACERALSIEGIVTLDKGPAPTGTGIIARREGAASDEAGAFVYVRSDPDGRFAIRGLPPGKYSLETSAPRGTSLSLAKTKLTGVAAGTSNLRLQLKLAQVIAGVVVDDAGDPLENVRIQAHSEAGHRFTPYADTDVKGAFQINGLDAANGPYRLYVTPQAARHLPNCELLPSVRPAQIDHIDVGRQDVRITLPRGEILEGVIRDSTGNPLPHAWIKAVCVDRQELSLYLVNWRHGPAAQADAEGRFRIEGLPRALFSMFLMEDPRRQPKASLQPLTGGQKVSSGSRALRLSPAQLRNASGVVQDEAGEPIAAARIVAWPTGTEARAGRVSGRSDARGRFTLEGLIQGVRYDIDVRAKDRAPWKRENVAVEAADLDVTLVRGHVLAGQLSVPEGESPNHRLLRAFHETSQFNSAGMTDADGNFRIEGLIPGKYRVQVQTNPGKSPPAMKDVGTFESESNDLRLILE